jgi:hypothetical protein
MEQPKIVPEGESTENWAINEPGFLGSMKQLLNCARCGEVPPFKRLDEPRYYRDVCKPTFHMLCDDCHDALPS